MITGAALVIILCGIIFGTLKAVDIIKYGTGNGVTTVGKQSISEKMKTIEKLIDENGLIEHAGYVGHYYGTPRKFVEDNLNNGIDVILEIELQGALQIKKQYKDAVMLFIMPPSAEELRNRLTGRGTEEADVIKKRLQKANEEAVGIENYDYIIVNDDLDESVECVHNIVEAAHNTPDRNEEFIESIRQQLKNLV